MSLLDRTRGKVVTAMATPEVAKGAAVVAAIALIVAILALGVAIGKGQANAN